MYIIKALNIEEFEDISHLQNEALARCLLEKAITRLFRQISKPLRYQREFLEKNIKELLLNC